MKLYFIPGNDREGKYITPARRQTSSSSNSGGAGGKQHMNAGKKTGI